MHNRGSVFVYNQRLVVELPSTSFFLTPHPSSSCSLTPTLPLLSSSSTPSVPIILLLSPPHHSSSSPCHHTLSLIILSIPSHFQLIFTSSPFTPFHSPPLPFALPLSYTDTTKRLRVRKLSVRGLNVSVSGHLGNTVKKYVKTILSFQAV